MKPGHRKALAEAVADLKTSYELMGQELAKVEALIPDEAPGTKRGEKSGAWVKIRELDAQGMPRADIARKLGIPYQSVRQCLEYRRQGGQ